ncbi:hypothetical protein AB3Y40_07560 [Yoonia sp. R2331]|uniref:hypothetical protein n=1 Tax=Yoonia sp. R2331 TaxID=3237238 RepID=UPI0034E60B10
MRPALPLALIAVVTATGCARVAESRLNPLNWFGSSTAVANVDAAGNLRPLVTAEMVRREVDGRVLIDSVETLEISRNAGGAIVRATGVAATQGSFNAQLVPVAFEGGTLTLAFRVEQPQGFQPQGETNTRRVTVARVLDATMLAGVRSIRVQAARNARISSR